MEGNGNFTGRQPAMANRQFKTAEKMATG